MCHAPAILPKPLLQQAHHNADLIQPFHQSSPFVLSLCHLVYLDQTSALAVLAEGSIQSNSCSGQAPKAALNT